MNARTNSVYPANRTAFLDAARGMYRRAQITSKRELFMALNNIIANVECEDEDVQLCLSALINAAGDLEGPAPELSAFDRRVA